MATPEESPNAAMLNVVSQFASDLQKLRSEEQAERVELLKNVELQGTALRHDMYGSILILNQEVLALKIRDEKREGDTKEWRETVIKHRETDAAERLAGQRFNRALLIALVVLFGAGVTALAGILYWLVVR